MEKNSLFYMLWMLLISYVGVLFVVKLVFHLWWRPRRIQNHFLKQGIKGPKYQLLLGNLKELACLNLIASAQPMTSSHNIVPRVLSFYHHWKNIYGSKFLIWFGSTPRLTISDPALIRDIFVLKSEFFEKIEPPPPIRKVEGDGLLNLKGGQKWAHRRKIIQPVFHAENLKLLIPMMGKTMEAAVAKWSEQMTNDGKVEIEVFEWFQKLVEDAITRTIFGNCSSYEDGKAVFELQSQQIAHATEAYQKIFTPGYRFLPTKRNRISWKLEKEIRESLLRLIGLRRRNNNSSSDSQSCLSDECCPSYLLELMIKSTNHQNNTSSSSSTDWSHRITENDIIEECKTIFFAGKHTTASLLTWTTVLLAMHPQWQDQAREELLKVCGLRDNIPTKDDLTKLKMLNMILNESLRPYPPAVATIRKAKADVHLGGVHILRGTELLIPIIALHHNPTLWHHDVHEFNPARFAKGVSQAVKHPMAFMPFGVGARRCIGQNLAILQAKLAITMLLQRFCWELAPSYQHSPAIVMLLYPQHGAPILFRKL